MTTAMSLRLPQKLAKALDELAVKVERPKSYLVRKILEEYLSDNSSYAWNSPAVKRTDWKVPPGKIGHSLDKFAGTWTKAHAKKVMDAMKDFERIDPELWK